MANGNSAEKLPPEGVSIPQSPPLQSVPSKFNQALSTGLVGAGFAQLGSAFAKAYQDPTLAEPYREMGSRIVGVMQDRWFKKELENFETQYGQEYTQQAQALSADLTEKMHRLDMGESINEIDGTVVKLDPSDEKSIRMRDAMLREYILGVAQLDDNVMKNASKYPGNPYIAERMQSLVASRAQLIGQLTGPTPAAASEEGYANIERQREEASYKRRQPFPDTSGGAAGDKTRGDPTKLLEEIGPARFMAHLTGTPTGQEWLNPFLDEEFAKEEQRLMMSNEVMKVDETARKAAMGAKTKELTQRAIANYMETTFPGRPEVEALKRSSQYGAWFPQEAAPEEVGQEELEAPLIQVRRKPNPREFRQNINVARDAALRHLNDVIADDPSIETIDDALTELNQWTKENLAYNPDVPETRKIAERIRKEVIEWIRKEQNWSQSETARRRFGAPTFGEEIGRTIGGAGEAVSETYRKGVLSARKGLLE